MKILSIRDKDVLFLCWIGISILLTIADYYSGPFIQFPITFLIPIALAAWFNGRWPGIALAILLPLLRLYYNTAFWTVPGTMVEAGINCAIRILVFGAFVIVIDRTASLTRRLSEEVHLLEGLLPICSFCKKIRDGNEEWQPLEKYIQERSQALFSHGLCPTCLKEHYGEFSGK